MTPAASANNIYALNGAPIPGADHFASGGRKSLVHLLSLAAVWLTIASSGIVFSEPAPVDVLQLGLIILLPVIALVRINRALIIYIALWLIVAACEFLASANAHDVPTAIQFSAISLYLTVASFVFAGFVARAPIAHSSLILNAWTVAALIAATTGLCGYLGIIPGAYELFTKFGRLAGTFKDPNVAGPFLVAPILYMLHLALTRSAAKAIPALVIAGVLSLAVLLTFSRGAWLNLFGAGALFGYLFFVTSSRNVQRLRITVLTLAGLSMAVVGLIIALQFDTFAELLNSRAAVTQSYDVGPEGRFGGQSKAIGLIAENPIGLGPQVFSTVHHAEEAHNVYLSMFMNAGWLGGGVYCILVGLTIVLGLRHTLCASQSRPLFLIVYASFLATALEGVIVDTDHWRFFYLLMAMVWGMMTASPERTLTAPAPRYRRDARILDGPRIA